MPASCVILWLFCVFLPSYLLLLITYFFLPSVVNKVQSNLLSKCGFLSPLASRECWQCCVCGLVGKKWSRQEEQADGWYSGPVLGDLRARKPGPNSHVLPSGPGPLIGKAWAPALTIQPKTSQGKSVTERDTQAHPSIRPSNRGLVPLVKCKPTV